MKKKFVSFMLLMSSVMSMTAAVNVSRIEPTDWFVGMKDASLQLMVYGKDIKNAEVSVNYPGVKIDSVAVIIHPVVHNVNMVVRLVVVTEDDKLGVHYPHSLEILP